MDKKIIVKLAQDADDYFYTITRSKGKEMMALAPNKRISFFLANAEEASVHSTAEVGGFIDASGNMTEEEFWEDEGNENWKLTLDNEV